MRNLDIKPPGRRIIRTPINLVPSKENVLLRFKRLWAAVLTLLLIIPFYTYQPNVSKADGPTNVYYSVGQNTTDHKTGSPTLSISSGLGTFSIPQTATNMGVGDKVTFNTSTVCYISSKTSTSVWTFITATGTTCGDVTGATVNSIAHAFSSLASALPSASGGAKGANFLNTTDLVTGNYILNVPVYYDTGPDTTLVRIQNWTTGPSNYINVYTPSDTSTEVNQSQRHDGKWDDTKYSLVVEADTKALWILVGYLRVDGLQIAHEGGVVLYQGPTDTNDIRISNSLIRGSVSGIYFNGPSANHVALTMWNSVLYGGSNESSPYGDIYIYSSTVQPSYIYNTTIDGGNMGIRVLSGTTYVKNVVVNNTFTDAFHQNPGATLHVNYSASNDATADDFDSDGVSGNNRVNQAFSFVDPGNGDFHLQTGDTAAKDRGMSDPGSGLFSDDIDGETRTGIWDMGADEEQATDTTSPTITEVTPVTSPTRDLTPSYTFNSTEAGTITYGGSCSSSTTAASSGNNTVTFSELTDDTYSNCTIKVTDGSSNQSNTLNISPFTIDSTLPYYIDNNDPGASDSNTGNQDSPFLTIGKCITVLTPGNICIVQDGTYAEDLTLSGSGTSGHVMQIKAEHERQAVLNGKITISGNYAKVDGFKVIIPDANTYGITVTGDHDQVTDSYVTPNSIPIGLNNTGITIGGNNNTVSNNYVEKTCYGYSLGGTDHVFDHNEATLLHIRDNCSDVDYSSFFGTGHLISNNYFHGINMSDSDTIGDAHVDCFQNFDNNGLENAAINVTIENNYCSDSHQGLIMSANNYHSSSDIIVRNNVFRRNYSWCSVITDITNVHFYNNTCDASDVGIYGFYCRGNQNVASCEFKNNIIYGSQSAASLHAYGIMETATLIDGIAGAPGKNNLIYTPGDTVTTGFANDIINQDPLFADPSAGDYNLQLNSPAIDAGLAIAGWDSPTDKLGVSRPQLSSWDIGAYEYAPDPDDGEDDDSEDPSPTPPPVPTPPASIRSLTPIQTVQEPSNDPPFLPPSPSQNNPPSIPDPFLNYLRYGMTSLEVKKLQMFLNEDQDTRLGNDGPGSPGKETSFFGPKTLNAVKRFQEKYLQDVLSPWNLTKGTGYAGKTTLAKINRLIRGGE